MEKIFKILVVDDEPDIVELVSYNLKKEGYSVFTANNGEDAIVQAKELIPDLILMDVMMPKLDGIEACREIRTIPELSNTIVAFLTARNEDYTQIAGFESGGDDYINKPIRPKVLLSRIKALLKRNVQIEPELKEMTFGVLRISVEEMMVYKNDKAIELTKKEFYLLQLLATKSGRVFPREEIYQKVWGDEIIVGDRTIDVHIRKIREKIGDNYIKTMKGVGYKFNVD